MQLALLCAKFKKLNPPTPLKLTNYPINCVLSSLIYAQTSQVICQALLTVFMLNYDNLSPDLYFNTQISDQY